MGCERYRGMDDNEERERAVCVSVRHSATESCVHSG